MPFDPALPADHSPLSSAEMRDQLKTLNTDKASTADVAGAIAGTANNMNAVGDLTVTISDPTQQGEVQAAVDKMNELLAALRR